jgi:hypothetical protein
MIYRDEINQIKSNQIKHSKSDLICGIKNKYSQNKKVKNDDIKF